MDADIQSELIKTQANKSGLERVLSVSMKGPPELKRDEKNQYLGEYKERVIKLLTKKQVKEPGIYPEIEEALQDQRAVKIIINGEIEHSFTEKYSKLALRLGKKYTVIHDPELKGDTGLVVVSSDAIDVEDITVKDRKINKKVALAT